MNNLGPGETPGLFMNNILISAQQQGASDVHIMADKPPYMRLYGQLKQMMGFTLLTEEDTKNLALSLINDEQEERFLKERELDFAFQSTEGIRFRVNYHWHRGTIAIAARIIANDIPTMVDLDMPKIMYNLLQLPAGLILMTGPTGCGKSTTLASMLNTINETRSVHIVTLEDPIEFVYESKKSLIKQRELGTDINSFAQGLKHVLRQDPNIIMIGEMRDPETIAAAVTLAETGHLVFATLHTYNAAQTIDRIIDVFPPYQQQQVRMQLSITLQAILSQRLLPLVGGGRVAARELLINNAAISNMIRENEVSQIKNILQTSAAEGMYSMDQSLIKMYKEDLITREDTAMYLSNKTLLNDF